VLRSRIPIRARLTISFALVGTLLLVAGAVISYHRVRGELDRSVNATLAARSADVALLMRNSGGGRTVDRLPPSDESIAQVLTPAGRVLDSTRALSRASVLTRAQLRQAQRAPTLIDRPVLPGTDGQLRLLARTAGPGGARRIIVVGVGLESRDEALASLRSESVVALAIAILLATVGAFLLASLTLRPVRALRRGAESISRTGPSARLPEPRTHDEIGELARTLNAMLARLESASERERRFLGDASHELRTPLALIQSELEVTLRGPRRLDVYARALRETQREVAHLTALANDLLLIAGVDDHQVPLHRAAVEPRAILDALVERYASRGVEERREIRVAHSDAGPIQADRLRLDQAIANLVENAFRYGKGPIGLVARRPPGSVELAVVDAGQGLPEAFVGRAFERFTRADPSRHGQGTGLGLAIVDLIARAHGGEAYIIQGAGSCEVGVRLPLSG
jgi:signal transduction histidine kinase